MHAHRLLMVTVLCVALAVPALAQQMTESFDGGQLENWELGEGAKVVQQGRSNVLKFQQHGFAGWMVQPAQSFTLQFSAMVQQESMLGVIFCNNGEPPNHSEYQLVFEGERLHLIKIANGQDAELGSGGSLSPNTWVTVSLQVNGGQMAVTLNNQQVISATDRQPLTQSGLAFHGFNAAIDTISLTGAAGGGIPMQTISQPVGGGGGGGQPAGGGGGGMGGGSQGMSSSYSGLALGQNASGVFLYIAGITGDVTQQALRGWIDCTDWEFSVNSQANQAPYDHSLTVSKRVCIATPRLWEICSSGQKAQEARLLVVRSGRVVLDVQMNNVTVLSAGRMMMGPFGQATTADTESVTLQPAQVKWSVPVYDAAGHVSTSYAGGYDYAKKRVLNP